MSNEILRACAKVLSKSDQCSDGYNVAAFAMYHAMTSAHREVLKQLVMTGPVWDGDVCSKSARDDLMTLGLAGRVCVKGEQGYTGANYDGWAVHKVSAGSV